MNLREIAPLPPGWSPRFLLIESVLSVARVLATFFHPFEVEIATSGASALDRLASLPPISAVVCNLILSDLDGRDLYRQACAQSPELRGRFVFMTDDQFRPLYDVGVSSPVFYRPFDPDLLLEILHILVGPSPPRAAV